MLKLQAIYTVPQWCLCYLANGDWDNMTEEEKAEVDEWYDREFPNGCTFDFGDGVHNEPYFSSVNDINNLGCDVQDIAAYVETDEVKREHVSVVAIESTSHDGIKVTVQENIPFIDIYEAESWAEWRYGNYDYYTIAPAHQFHFS